MFSASGKAIEFAGFRRAYVEGSDDPAAELEDQETLLPKLTAGDLVDRQKRRACARSRLEPKRHDTSPPARYTEASLIKELEGQGIGRPVHLRSTIGTIERRGYIFRQGKALVPSFTAFAVTRLLREHFSDLSTSSSRRRWKKISIRSRAVSARDRLHAPVLPRRQAAPRP